MEKDVVELLCRKYGKSEKIIKLFIKICKDYDIDNSEERIEEFIKGVSKGVSKKDIQDI